jgi:hypothetical protein
MKLFVNYLVIELLASVTESHKSLLRGMHRKRRDFVSDCELKYQHSVRQTHKFRGTSEDNKQNS